MENRKLNSTQYTRYAAIFIALAMILVWNIPGAVSQALPGGTLDPTTIPKYITPLVIPPVMNNSGTSNDYDIAVRQFQQQILPGGIMGQAGGTRLPATTVWSYGPAEDPLPDSSGITGGAVGVAPAQNSQFNYPAFTVENTVNTSDHGRLDQ